MADPLRQTYGEVFFLTSGLQRDPYGLANFHPASNVNRLDIYLEDGVSTNVVMVNFKADGKGYPTSVFFPTLYGGTVQKVITGEASARSFSKYSLLVPPQVLQWNANGTSTLSLQTTVVQTAGDGLLGAFENYTALTTAHPATEDLMDAGSIAYVYTTVGSDEYGFYAVTYNSEAETYSWTLVDNPVTQINMVDTKQYNIVGMQIQKGNLPRPTSTVTISDEYIRYILAYIATVNDNCNLNKDTLDDHEIRITALETDVDAIIAGTQDITFNNTISGLVATTLKGAVDEVAIAISNMKDGTDAFTKLTLTDGNGNYADIYFDGVNIIKDYRDGVLAEDSQNLYVPIKAREAFSDGDIIQYDGSVGASGKIWAKKAVQSEINANPRLILGMATTSVSANEEHERAVSFYGSVGSLNTADSLGYYVYYDSEGSTAGGYVLVNPASPTNRPTAPHVRVFIGVVAVAHATNGIVNVRPDFGRKLSELHDVYLNGGAIEGSNIKYNASTLRWEVDNRTTSLITANMFKDVSYTASTGVLLFTKYDNTTKSIDLPLELIVESGYYDEDTNELVLVLANASEIRIPVGDLLSDLDAVNIRYDNGDSTLVAVNVKTALDELDAKAETNASNIADLDTNKEDVANKVTSFQATPDNDKYPSEKLVYDTIKNIGLDTPITELNNHSLREVFEDGNLISNATSIKNANGIATSINIAILIDTNVQVYANNKYYSRFDIKYNVMPLDRFDAYRYYNGAHITSYINFGIIEQDVIYSYSTNYEVTSNQLGNLSLFLYGTSIGDTYDIDTFNNYLINITSLGIDTLTVEQMDYWYGVYEAIKNNSTTYVLLNTLYDLFSSKANTTLEDWVTPTLTSATTTYLKYRKDTLGTVIIEGNLTVTTAGTNFTLPTGYRPLFTYVQGDLTFNTDGTVVSASTGLKYINVRFTGGA